MTHTVILRCDSSIDNYYKVAEASRWAGQHCGSYRGWQYYTEDTLWVKNLLTGYQYLFDEGKDAALFALKWGS